MNDPHEINPASSPVSGTTLSRSSLQTFPRPLLADLSRYGAGMGTGPNFFQGNTD